MLSLKLWLLLRVKMNDNKKKNEIEFLKECGIPTKEEFFQRQMSQQKQENNSGKSENFAEKLLKQIAFPEFHHVDGNTIYANEIKRRNKSRTLPKMLTPDFVVGSEPIEANNPTDFYIDVNEITEGVWGNFNDDSNKFPDGNSIKKMYQELNEKSYTSEKPYRFLLNESRPDLVHGLYKQLISKSQKYSSKRNGSTRFGLISVLAKDGFHIAQIQYLKLIISIFENMLDPYFFKNSELDICAQLRAIKLSFLNPGEKTGFVPIICPFEGDWCFWIIAGTSVFEGDVLCLVNSTVLNSLANDDPVANWIKQVSNI